LKRSVLWTEPASDDVDAIAAYISIDNPSAARRVASAIVDAGDGLAEMPTGRPGRVNGTYEKVVRGLPYIIAYALQGRPGGNEIVIILHVIHGARNWPEEEWPQ
jgi:plasmid stabilization system protein ParE